MQRNGQNPIKAGKIFDNKNVAGGPGAYNKMTSGGGHCPACGAEVPPKPGFRFSSLKCPKCGASMAKK